MQDDYIMPCIDNWGTYVYQKTTRVIKAIEINISVSVALTKHDKI